MWARAPWLLIFFRLIAGPAMILAAWRGGDAARIPCAILLGLGVLSDIFDGVIARRMGCVTDRLRAFDSRTDVVFWVSALGAAILFNPGLVERVWLMVATLVVLEIAAHAVSMARFGKEASPHHLLSKIFGLSLWALLSVLFVTGAGGLVLIAAFVVGVASEIESIAIMLALPEWRTDVRSLSAARHLKLKAHA